MFGRSTIASTSARTSGSEVGYGPAPCCSPSGAQSAGQFRFRSSPSSGGRDLHRHAVPVLDRALREHAEEVALDVVRPARDEQPRVVRVRLPGPVRVGLPHHQHAPVAVDVLAVEPVLRLLAWVRAHARAPEAPVREARVGAVRVHARDDVERARVERLRDPLVLAVAVQQAVEEAQRGGRPRELHRVDLRVDEDRRLLLGRPGLEVRHRDERDVAPLVRLADRLDPAQARELGRPRVERLGQLGVRVEAVEADARRHAARP